MDAEKASISDQLCLVMLLRVNSKQSPGSLHHTSREMQHGYTPRSAGTLIGAGQTPQLELHQLTSPDLMSLRQCPGPGLAHRVGGTSWSWWYDLTSQEADETQQYSTILFNMPVPLLRRMTP